MGAACGFRLVVVAARRSSGAARLAEEAKAAAREAVQAKVEALAH